VAIVLLVACGRIGASRNEPVDADVYLVIVDGLGAASVVPEHMPRLSAVVQRSNASALTALAVMPTLTNPNHASLLTGVHPEVHGVTGNRYAAAGSSHDLDDPALLEMETLFTSIERQQPAIGTVAVFGKSKLRRLFAAVPPQRGADWTWTPVPERAYGDDVRAMTEFRALVRAHRPRFAVLAIGDVDRMGHERGPRSAEYLGAIEQADVLIAGFLDELRRDDRWDRSVVLVTADHGFDETRPGAAGVIEGRTLGTGGATIVPDCRVAHVYGGSGDPSAVAKRLRAIARRAERHPGVAGVYTLSEGAGGVPAPDDWHGHHPRAGALLLMARPGYAFVDGPSDPVRFFRGNHGAATERFVPLLVTGGHPALRKAPAGVRPSSVDVAPTIARLLTVHPPRRLDGTPPPPGSTGRVLEEILTP
jgi:arylsulfatase A-like enzyme